MQKHIIDEKTGIPYTLVGDYYLPWGDLPDIAPEQRHIGIWGQRHLRYIKQNRKSLYIELKMSGKLNDYLADINEEAEEMYARLVKKMAEQQNVTEQLKSENQMKWIADMNSISASAKEIICSNFIYA